MSKRLVLCKLMIMAIVLMNLPLAQAQMVAAEGSKIKASSYLDDPFVAGSDVGRLGASRVGRDENGQPFLSGKRVSMIDEDFIYRKDSATGNFSKFAFNPWPKDGRANQKGNFIFADEARFPIHETERDAEGKIILRDGLQVWTPRDLRLGITTAFTASNAARDAAEDWAGRDIAWGVDNVLEIESHVFIDFNAEYSPSARMIFCGVVPYRLPGETQVKMFETVTSWELVAHESGHALHNVLKPNVDNTDIGFNTWGESFADQTAMWASLGDSRRVRAVLEETNGNLHTSNSLTRICEAFAALIGSGTGIRDAFHDKKVSDTTDEVHDRSEVLTGAAYKVFTLIYDGLKNGKGRDDGAALAEAGDIMGSLLMHTTDYTPENVMTLEDVGKAYLKVDKELYGGRYQAMLADELIRREIFDGDSVGEWRAHEASVPDLKLPHNTSNKKVDKFVQANLSKLGIGPEFGLKLQSVTHDERFGQTIVRVQLTDGRGEDAPVFDNAGVLVFRADRTLADYHSPLPEEAASPKMAQATVRARAAVDQARQFGLDRRGGRLTILRRPDGDYRVEARVMRGQGITCWVEAYSLEHPAGERREVIVPTFPQRFGGLQPNGVQILAADDLAN